ETAARLRDEVKRLRETELAVSDDPLARQSEVEDKAGAYKGERKYGHAPTESGSSKIKTEYEPVQPTHAQQSSVPLPTRARKPTLDDMGPGTDRAIPARKPSVDPRAKAGAFGEGVRGPHKPTLDEMGPHAMLPPKSGTPPSRPTRTVDVPTEAEKKG